MDYGTIKSEVRSNNKDVAEEYYHYEIITRWWQAESGVGVEWKHNLFCIDRNGTMIRYGEGSPFNEWFEPVHRLLHVDKVSSAGLYYNIRDQIASEHYEIVRRCMG